LCDFNGIFTYIKKGNKGGCINTILTKILLFFGNKGYFRRVKNVKKCRNSAVTLP